MFMQIKRNILGTEVVIDLTEGEILDAHYEAEKYEAQESLNERLMEELFRQEIPADLFAEMVKEVVKEKEAMDTNMGNNLIPAIEAVIEKHKDELKKYKEEPYELFEKKATQTRSHTWTIKARSAEDADRIFDEWRERNMIEYDQEIADAEIDDDDIESAYAVEGNPEYADICEEE